MLPPLLYSNTAYIASWTEGAKDDKRQVLSAASHAQRAADYLHGLYPRQTQEIEDSHRAAA